MPVTPQRRVTRRSPAGGPNGRCVVTPAVPHLAVTRSAQLVLSLFPGVDLLGWAFSEAGFSIVTGPEALWGGAIEDFRGVPGRFDGVIGGPPCQDFSCRRRAAPTGEGIRLVREFLRVVAECDPLWFLMENVPRVPDVRLDGWQVQRFDLWDKECGGVQLRCRHFQFGHKLGWIVRPKRKPVTHRGAVRVVNARAAAVASGFWGRTHSFRQHCLDQGLPGSLRLPGLRPSIAWRVVGNGVPLGMGRVVARAVLAASPRDHAADCRCGCGRLVTGRQVTATAACRKRLERLRRGSRRVICFP